MPSLQANGHVFVSYARADGLNYVQRLEEALRAKGFDVWYDQRSRNPYTDFSVEIERAIKGASHVVVCLTRSVTRRRDSFVRREILYAQGQNKPIIPLILPRFPKKEVPVLINHLTWIDFGDFASGIGQLLDRLAAAHQFVPSTGFRDAFGDHVKRLYDYSITHLEQTVFAVQEMLTVGTTASEVASHAEVLPAYALRQPVWFKTSHPSPDQFDSIAEAFEYYEGRVLLRGAPGSGKTTTLVAFAREKAAERLADPSALLPIYAPVTTWSGQANIVAWLANVTGTNANALRKELRARRVLLLLDDLDVAFQRDPSRISEFVKVINSVDTPVLLACRTEEYENIVNRSATSLRLNGEVTLKPLSDEQLDTYLETIPALRSAIRLDSELREMMRTPLILTLFAIGYREAGDQIAQLQDLRNSPPDLRDRVIRTYVEKRYEFEQARHDQPLAYSIEDIYDTLGWETFYIRSSAFQVFWVGSYEEVLFDPNSGWDFLDLALRLHLLISGTDGSLRFMHRLIHDHFAFLYALAKLNDSDPVIRRGAARALAWITDRRATSLLIDALNDVPEVSTMAAEALGSFAQADPDFRARVRRKLRKFGNRDLVNHFDSFAQSPNLRP